MLVPIALAGLVASAIMLGLLSLALRDLERCPIPRAVLPPITVIRPVRGLDAELEENVRAALRQRYPVPYETLFVLDDAREPALPVIARAITLEGAASRARIVLAGAPPRGRTGKLHAMIRGLASAREHTPLVAFADSDTRPGAGVLAALASVVVASPDVGAAFARAIGIRPPRTMADVAYGLLLDGLYAPQAALAMRRRGSLPFVMGQTMVLRRSALDACGGLEGSEGELVDDMHIGARLAAAGHRNVLCSAPVAIVQQRMGWAELRATVLRWMVFGRTGIPWWPFNAPVALWITTFVLGIAGAVLALASGDLVALALTLACSTSVVIGLDLLRRRQGGAPLPWWLWWAPFACLATVPWFFARARFARTIAWRGRTYRLDASGRLREPDADGVPKATPRSAVASVFLRSRTAS
jgi:ceramide glucosyltransferase